MNERQITGLVDLSDKRNALWRDVFVACMGGWVSRMGHPVSRDNREILINDAKAIAEAALQEAIKSGKV